MKRYIYLIVAVFYLNGAFAQFFSTVIDEQELKFKVKQIDEFMHRFNYDIAYDGSSPVFMKDSATYVAERTKNMLTLFNLDKFLTKEKKPSIITQQIISYVIKNNIRLEYANSSWYAKLKCNCTYLGRKSTMLIDLRVEKIKGVEYKWVISDVNGSLFAAMKDTVDVSTFISPADHGIGFISLPHTINSNYKVVNSFAYKGHKNDRLSVFNFMVANQMLKINNVESVSYHYSLGKYNIVVERVEKTNSYNKGWLINSITVK